MIGCHRYTYTYIGIVWLRAPNESRPFHSSWTRTLLGGRVKRAQLLWNVHNFLQPWTTSMNSMTSSQTLQRALNQTTPNHIYILCSPLWILDDPNSSTSWCWWRFSHFSAPLTIPWPKQMGDCAGQNRGAGWELWTPRNLHLMSFIEEMRSVGLWGNCKGPIHR